MTKTTANPRWNEVQQKATQLANESPSLTNTEAEDWWKKNAPYHRRISSQQDAALFAHEYKRAQEINHGVGWEKLHNDKH